MEDVTGAMRLDRVLAERLAQVRDVPLDEIRGSRRWILAPELVYEPAAGYDAVRLREQRDEDRALTRPSELRRAAVDDHLEWSEQPVLDRVHGGERTTRHIESTRRASVPRRRLECDRPRPLAQRTTSFCIAQRAAAARVETLILL